MSALDIAAVVAASYPAVSSCFPISRTRPNSLLLNQAVKLSGRPRRKSSHPRSLFLSVVREAPRRRHSIESSAENTQTPSIPVVNQSPSSTDNKQSSSNPLGAFWLSRLWEGKESLADRVMASIVNGSASAVGSYVAQPVTWMHQLDPRVKQLWLLAFVALPARAGISFRLGLCVLLALLTLLSLPRKTSAPQLLQSLSLSLLLFVGLAFSADGIRTLGQPRTVPLSVENLPPLVPAPAGISRHLASFCPSLFGYSYVLLRLGPFELTRRGARLGLQAGTFSFLVLQSAALGLTTTTPEATAAALRWALQPLKVVGLPVDSVVLTLLLSLRFLGLVFDEARNLALGVLARGVEWRRLQLLGTVDVFVGLAGRLFQNLFAHADQISQAMVARGFGGDPAFHRLYLFADTQLVRGDWLALLLLLLLAGGAWRKGWLLSS